MRTIHKYVLSHATNKVATLEGARFLHVANQREQIAVWAEVNTLAAERMATLHVVGTGGAIVGGRYVGSAVMADGALVFHVYEEGDA